MAAAQTMAAADALKVIVNRDVDGRLLNRERYKVNFRPGTPLRAGLPPRRLPYGHGRGPSAWQRRAGASQVQGDKYGYFM